MKHWPFKVEQGTGDKPMIVVNFKNEVKKFHPEEISSMVLQKMRDNLIWAIANLCTGSSTIGKHIILELKVPSIIA